MNDSIQNLYLHPNPYRQEFKMAGYYSLLTLKGPLDHHHPHSNFFILQMIQLKFMPEIPRASTVI